MLFDILQNQCISERNIFIFGRRTELSKISSRLASLSGWIVVITAISAVITVSTETAIISTEAAAKPLRFVLSIGLLNKPGDTVNPMCYSNVITRPGPPGWGAPGFLPPGSGQQAHDIVQSFKAAFIARCRASGREITSEGNFNYAWDQSQGSEAGMQDVRPRHREDVLVSL